MNPYVFYPVGFIVFLIIWYSIAQMIKKTSHDKKRMQGDGLIAMCLAVLTYMAIGAGIAILKNF